MLTEEKRVLQQEYSAVRKASSKTRRRLLIALAIVSGIILLLLGMVLLLGKLFEPKEDTPPDFDYWFYPPYEGDIMQNSEYLELDRSISYCADPSGYGLTQTITEENRADMDTAVLFLCDYLQTIIDGDHAAYNAMFSPSYIEKEGECAAFSSQMLYNMQITYLGECINGEDRLVNYKLSYMIHRNDGSFRRDIESDASRPQELTLRISPDGHAMIEQLITYYPKK